MDDANKKKADYQAILEKYPNHSGLDYERFLFRKLRIEGAKIRTARGPLTMGFWRFLRYLGPELINLVLKLGLISAPVIIVYIIYVAS